MPINVGVMFVGPLIAMIAIAGLAIVLRWTFSHDDGDRMTRLIADDYGLLAAVAVLDSISAAQQVRTVLAAAGIRATISVGNDAMVRVLVFGQEFDHARRLVGGNI